MGQKEDLEAGITVYVQGSGKEPYKLQHVSTAYSCSCPSWRNAGGPIDKRTCKHLGKIRGFAAEEKRLQEGDLEKLFRATTGGVSVAEIKKEKEAEEEAEVEGKGKGPPVLLAHKWEVDQDPKDWWMSEKLDGVRAYWDGQKFISRLGNEFFAPDFFRAGLPDHPLDGELWMGRKKFQDTVSIVRQLNAGDYWKRLRFLVFDAPHLKTSFEHRMTSLARLEHPYVTLVTQERCKGVEHLKTELARVEALGAEGLMLRQPGSLYESGRSYSLLKVKTFHDAEGRVIGYEPGKGKHKGRIGALQIRAANGVEFKVGTGFSDKERENPPAVGSVITYRYQELTRDNVPRFPSYVGQPVDKR
jgi:DNA ligase-1